MMPSFSLVDDLVTPRLGVGILLGEGRVVGCAPPDPLPWPLVAQFGQGALPQSCRRVFGGHFSLLQAGVSLAV